MSRYIFKEQSIEKEYRYIFLCGAHYNKKDKLDKRKVLRKYLESVDNCYRPIILEENFVFTKNSKKYLVYDDIHMKDLYQVEMLMNYLADNNVIIHESISTGAEAGLFLSEKNAICKTCLLLPDEIAVEENKLGQFLKLAFQQKEPYLKTITYYPRVEENICSQNFRNWHTYFYGDQIGKNLEQEIITFLNSRNVPNLLKFSKSVCKIDEGQIHYKVINGELSITALPRIIMICVASVLNIDNIQKSIFNSKSKELREYIQIIKNAMEEVFINTVEEMLGKQIRGCSIKAKMNINSVYISQIIGMSLYLFQAAGFIIIIKDEDYADTRKLCINRKMLCSSERKNHFFYEKYSSCIDIVVGVQIV